MKTYIEELDAWLKAVNKYDEFHKAFCKLHSTTLLEQVTKMCMKPERYLQALIRWSDTPTSSACWNGLNNLWREYCKNNNFK